MKKKEENVYQMKKKTYGKFLLAVRTRACMLDIISKEYKLL